MWRSKKLVIFSALVVATLSFFVYQKVVAATAPDLKEGTYLTGQTLSVWPSWSTLGNSLGQALPIDPINQLGLAGTCARRTGVFCTTDSQCESPVNTTSEKCVLHDPETGWSTADRRFAFVCSKDSYAYRYIVSTTPGFYTVRARFEDTGIPVANFNSFAAGFVSTSVFIINNSSGICNQDPEISTMQAGTCGDGKLNLNKGEQCDPPGTIEYKTGCRGTIKDLSVCNSNCQWVASTTKCSSLSRCGNGVLESGETCDDGSLNGKYNHCGINCSSVSALGRCGDNTLQSAYEVCDPGTPGQEKYALTQNNSCAWDCQNFGPYCGDAVTQTEHGEECDGNQSCTVDGKRGVKVCTSGCKKVMSATAPTEWECKVGSTATAAVSAPGTCGDAVVGANEACDKGLSNNGRACAPVYDKSCSYCSADCQNTIDVQPTQYCGNGYIESIEKCDVFNGAIYSVAASVSSTLANKDSARNGYQELACMGEPTDPHTMKKGTKSCDSCTGGVARNCVTCGVDKNGVAVGGGIINVLDKADPLFAKVPGSGGGSLSLAIGACFDLSTGQQYAAPRYIPGQGWVGGAPPSRCYDPTFSGSLILGRDTKNSASTNLTTYNLLNPFGAGNALVNSAPICSTDTNADYKYRMYVNDNWARPFDFPVVAQPATWQYDMVLSPVVAKATRSKDLRIVASWNPEWPAQ